MYLTTYKPFDNLIDNFFSLESSKNAFEPKANIYEDDKNYHLDLELAGVNKKDIKIEIKEGTLLIKGEKEKKVKEPNRIESFYGKFERSFNLGDEVEETSIEASHKDGILSMTLPKREEVKERKLIKKIEIK